MSDIEKAGWSPLLLRRAERLMTVDEVCEYLRVHYNTIYRLIKQGRIPAFRVGSRWRVNVEHIELWSHHGGPDD